MCGHIASQDQGTTHPALADGAAFESVAGITTTYT